MGKPGHPDTESIENVGSDNSRMRAVYEHMKLAEESGHDGGFSRQVKDAKNQYRKDRLVAMRWFSILNKFGWKFVILAEQVQHSWILFDEPRLSSVPL